MKAFGSNDTFMSVVMISLYAIPAVLGALLMLVAPPRVASLAREEVGTAR